ncbi:ImmA/IrrE family metallo-endopeptidase [Endozoicomonas sp.]|uniref:ImmA/IrrE family metallo-endopeptidase n=1 Tax=Endozoicomonas sp. TaxID=1892382 RepID=UPI00383A274F
MMSVIKVIKTAEDHADAMERLMNLMDVDPAEGSVEDNELEVLAVLIEQYESEQFPTDLPDPIEAIKFRMDQQGLTQKDMKPFLGSASKTSEVLNGKRPLSLLMIRKLHKGLEIPADVLIQEKGALLPGTNGMVWNQFPLAEMKKRGCFSDFSGSLHELKAYAEENLRRFLSSVRSDYIKPALCRTSAHYVTDKEVDQYALLAWQIRVLQKAEKIKTAGGYEHNAITPEAMKELARISWSEQGPKVAREFLSVLGIKLVTEPHFEKTYLDGAAMLDSSGQPVIGLTLRHDRLDNFWFTLLHEVAHIALHLNTDSMTFFDDIDSSQKDDIEHEADRAAAEALIDQSVWSTAMVRKSLNERDCATLAKDLKIHPAIVAGRLRHENKNYSLLSNMIGNKMVRHHFQ